MSVSLWDSPYALLLLRALDCALTCVQSVCGHCLWEVYCGERTVFICNAPVKYVFVEKVESFVSSITRQQCRVKEQYTE